MPKRRHSEEQIIYALKRVESGVKGLEVCREMGISEQTLYVWKRKYAGMGVGELLAAVCDHSLSGVPLDPRPADHPALV